MAKKKEQEKKKKVEKKKRKYTIWQAILYTILLFGFLGVLAVALVGTAFFIYIAKTAPPFNPEALYSTEPSQMYDANGGLMATIGTQDRVVLTYDEIPEVLVNAIVATEDSRFFQHNGFDLPRFLVASVKQVLGQSDAGGASTLTMQLSKKNYTSDVASGWEGIKRKFQDIYISIFKIETTYSKQEILEFYTNSNQLGNGYGVEAAAKTYFGKSAKDLNVSEAALLAGMFQAPTLYNPYFYPENAEARRKVVLSLMYRHQYINDAEYKIALDMTVDKIVQERQGNTFSSDFVSSETQSFIDMVIDDVQKKTGMSPYTTSMKIYTTMDPKAQKHLSDIMNGKTYKWQNSKVQAAVAVVDTKTGAIVAISGGRNISTARGLNRATEAPQQIGSTAKPLYDYGPAVEYLNWNTGTIINDAKTTYSDGTAINNYDGRYKGFDTIENHLVDSRNIPALKTFKAVPKKDIIEFALSLGLTPEIYSCNAGYSLVNRKYCQNNEDPSIIVDANKSNTIHEAHAIGGYAGETPLTMATAYSAFGNGGYYNESYSFTKVEYADGKTFVNKTETKQVMQDSTAYIITSMLQKAAKSYSYYNVNGIKYAAKTGTTNFDQKTMKAKKLKSNAVRDLWIVGYNTDYSIAVWYGYDDLTKGTNTFGSTQHQKLFQAIAKGIFKNKDGFKQPESVVKVTVEKDSAVPLLPSANTPSNYKTSYLFVSGTEPNQVSTRFNKLTDVSNISSTNNGDGTATVTWTGIATPDALNLDYLTKLNAAGFYDNSASKYASNVLKKNQSLFGSLGYNVYIKDDSGNLTLLGWTNQTNYTIAKPTGTYQVVIRSCYSKYASLMSNGKSTTVTITGGNYYPPTEPTPVDPNTPTH